MKRTLVLGLGLGAVLLAACQVIAGIERVQKVDESTLPEAGPGTSTSSSGVIPANDPCKHVVPPPPPDGGADPTELPDTYLATTHLSLVDPAENGINGYDLDSTCECDKRSGTAFDGGASCTPRAGKTNKCDSDGGVDNEGAALFKSFYVVAQQNLDDSFNADAKSGKRNILLYLKGWNGQPNDLDVSVGIFVSNTANVSPADQGGTGDWTRPQTVALPGGPAGQAIGYVANGTLVVRNAGIVKVLFGAAGLTFNDAIIIGDLARDGAGVVKFTGVVGGRIRDDDLLSSAGQVKVSGADPACGTPYWPLIKTKICDQLDIGHAALADFKGAECDAISAAIAITAVTTIVSGDPVDTAPDDVPNPCAPDKINGTNPSLYKCN